MTFSVVVLAAGQGTRMKSKRPKVLHQIAGKPMLHHVLQEVMNLSPQQTFVVCGHKGSLLQASCSGLGVEWVWQEQQLGTGHAMQCAYPALSSTSRVLVLYGDVPLIQSSTLHNFLCSTPNDALGILTTVMNDPGALGRVVRDSQGKVSAIIEAKDATSSQLEIKEINSGIYILPYKHLATWLSNLKSNNAQKELYLTDVVAMAASDGIPVLSYVVSEPQEVLGVNTQEQLSELERAYQLRWATNLQQRGAKLYDPARIDVRGNLTVGSDVEIDINTIFEGDVSLGDNVKIGSNVIIKDSVIAQGTKIFPNTIVDGSVIGADCQIGPFARLRPGTQVAEKCKIGNFVEIKKSSVNCNSKINHLSYIGDSEVGKRVNVGAGVVTCNYDGASKHKTVVADDVFIGSNCELIAPVKIGEGATLGAGTTLTKDAPARALTLSKKILTCIVDWARPMKQKEET